MSENKKEGKFQNLKQWCQFWRQLKNPIILANQKLPFLKRVSIKTSHKCCGNAKSHPTAKGRKQLNLWMVRIEQDAINQRSHHINICGVESVEGDSFSTKKEQHIHHIYTCSGWGRLRLSIIFCLLHNYWSQFTVIHFPFLFISV